ncbi:hypothetical protein DPX16_14572 [Anabarilius grahami]|uniref:Uncharacterized protein n=1 Tax=Anabarilius grahami TaxID=495550 RepID=A0A3N0YY81_ANAGA|nr:hypothetical protein DPX16_14572 [Anabarilius grahami]
MTGRSERTSSAEMHSTTVSVQKETHAGSRVLDREKPALVPLAALQVIVISAALRRLSRCNVLSTSR